MPFDQITCPVAGAEATLRAHARRLIRTHGARIACAARRIDGPDGAALADAVRDMICDSELMPEAWPLDELLERLKRETRDVQVPKVVARLEALRHEIEELAILRELEEES